MGCRQEPAERIRGKDGEGRPFAIFATICPYEENRLLCEERTLSPIPSVAKAVKTASGIRPNKGDESYDAQRRKALVCGSSFSTFGHGGNSAVGVPFFRLR
jgi:hypothetical protein